jgi:hypothetical protein
MESNKTLYEYNEEESRRRLIPVIYLGFLLLMGAIGNVLVLIIYPLRFPNTTRTIFITGLAIPDLLICIVVIPFEIVEVRFQYMFYNEIACKIFRTFSTWYSLESMFVLMELSFDTYKKICKPFKIQITIKQAKLYIGCAFILSMFIAGSSLLNSGTRLVKFDNYTTGYDCSLADEYVDTLLPVIGEGLILIISISCMIVLIVNYSLIGRKILKQSIFRRQFQIAKSSNTSDVIKLDDTHNGEVFTMAGSNESTQNIETLNKDNERKKKEKSSLRRVTKIAFVVSVVFILSYIPHVAISLLTAVKGSFLLEPGPVVSALMPILARSVMINNVANPIIYGFMDKRFRQNCKIIFMTLLCCRK